MIRTLHGRPFMKSIRASSPEVHGFNFKAAGREGIHHVSLQKILILDDED